MSDPNRKEEKARLKGERDKKYAEEMFLLGSMGIEFKEWPKIKRLNRDIVITEKIDGTNSAIGIVGDYDDTSASASHSDGTVTYRKVALEKPVVYAQSRTRILTREQDNFGFAAWVEDNADRLAAALGPGLHFGEWWGKGIQRGYGLDGRRFSLFNVHRWTIPGMEGQPNALAPEIESLKDLGVDIVPVLYQGPMVQVSGFVNEPESFKERFVPHLVAEMLRRGGSQAAPGYDKPEGIVVFHTASGVAMKMTLEDDGKHKGEV